MATKNIQSTDFDTEVLNSDKYVLVDFWAPWCGPCRMMDPALEELSDDKDLSNELEVMKLNIEEGDNRNLAILYEVRGIPNMKLFYKGKIVDEFVGLMPKEALKDQLSQTISKQ